MPTFNTGELIATLSHDINETIITAKQLLAMPPVLLNKQPAAGKWSIAQVVEHLNSYNRYYLPEIQKTLIAGKTTPFNTSFKAGVFGNYFTNMMQPKADGRIANKMQAPKDHRPADILQTEKVLAEFIAGQERLLSFLADAARTDMGKLKVPISISRFIKLKLGDTFRFLVAHQLRHFIQISNIIAVVDSQTNIVSVPA